MRYWPNSTTRPTYEWAPARLIKLNTPSAARLEQRASEVLSAPVAYVQLRSALLQRGDKLVDEYRPLLGLGDEQVQDLLDYLRPWNAISRCCGVQMSSKWLRVLLSYNGTGTVGGALPAGWRRHFCASLDLEATERALIGTRVHQRFFANESKAYAEGLRHRRRMHHPWTGHHCSALAEDIKRLIHAPGCEEQFLRNGVAGIKLNRELTRLRSADAMGRRVKYHPPYCSRVPPSLVECAQREEC